MSGSYDRTRGAAEVHRRWFEASPKNLREVRRFVATCLQRDGAPSSVVDDLQLVASELSANAVQHGDGSRILVVVDCDDPAWWSIRVSGSVAVHVDAASVSTNAHGPTPAPSATGGRGLRIVAHLSDEIRVDDDDPVLTVTCRVRRRGDE